MEGYWIGHLNKTKVDPKEILTTYEKLDTMKAIDVVHFWNTVMGIGFVDAQNRLSKEQVLSLCSTDGIQSSDPGPCYMGVDQNNGIHVVISKNLPNRSKIVFLGIYSDWAELDPLMDDFNVTLCVVDALPEKRNAFAFAKRHEGRVFCNYYNDHQKGEYKWDEGQYVVECNRTESLDNSHREIDQAQVELPKKSCGITQTFADHMHNVAKKLHEDDITGSRRYVYIRLSGEDHFRHAFNYECMARQEASTRYFADCPLT